MRKLRSGRSATAPVAALLAAALAVVGACDPSVQGALPLLVVSGPDDFLSFEVRSASGEAIWRLEATQPTPVPTFVYGVVPEGFRQTAPDARGPRPLDPGEDLLLKSRTTDRVFVHRGYADSQSTLVIVEWGMRRLDATR